MSQDLIIDWFKNKRLEGDDKYYPAKKVASDLYRKGHNVCMPGIYPKLKSLVKCKVLEADKAFCFQRNFRYRLK